MIMEKHGKGKIGILKKPLFKQGKHISQTPIFPIFLSELELIKTEINDKKTRYKPKKDFSYYFKKAKQAFTNGDMGKANYYKKQAYRVKQEEEKTL